MSSRWSGSEVPRGDAYDARWRSLAAAGRSIHGEADLVDALLQAEGGTRVLDAGCGTGRVAIELAARGYDVVGVDLDRHMLDAARAKAPALRFIEADLATLDLIADVAGSSEGPDRFDVAVMAGNVMIFVAAGTEGAVLGSLAAHLRPGGLVVAGYQLGPGRLTLGEYDRLAGEAGLTLVDRWSTWEREPFAGGDYAVSVHRVTVGESVTAKPARRGCR